MRIKAVRSDLAGIEPLRWAALDEARFQRRYDACHRRGRADHYLLTLDGSTIGYGAVKGQEIPDRDTIFEFFLPRATRSRCGDAFEALARTSGARWAEPQSNDLLLFEMTCRFGRDISSDTILFEWEQHVGLTNPGATFRRKRDGEPIFKHRSEPAGDWVLERGGQVVASGGYLTHYNQPFVDLYMEVEAGHRNAGLGSYLVQEVARTCRDSGHVPAARCRIDNAASAATLRKAGLKSCGLMLRAAIG